MQSKWHKPRKKLYLKEKSLPGLYTPTAKTPIHTRRTYLHPTSVLTECLACIGLIQPSMIREREL
jgi:hypothetical protein